MLVSDFDFDLPAELIAQHPAPRGESRLFVVGDDRPHRRVSDLPDLLAPGDLLVVNDTRVLAARLYARTLSGAKVELLLVHRESEAVWSVLAKPGRRARSGTRLLLGAENQPPALEAEVLDTAVSGQYRVRFSEPVEPHLETIGHVPLPPYIHRPDLADDRDRYQTVYAQSPGAIAAPTAGLHFTEELLAELQRRGVGLARITLHVGIGTFKPVRAELVSDHRMDEEEYLIPQEAATAIEQTATGGGRVIAVGTTVVRALESSARSSPPAGSPLLPGRARTDLFIYPGFEFRVVDRLLTNFHLPRSSLLMLVSAFAGRERVLAAYREAVRERYRFYSYGDAMLLEPAPGRS